MMKLIIKIILINVFIINTFAVNKDIFQFNFDSDCNAKCRKILGQELKVLIEFDMNNVKNIDGLDFIILQDAIEIGNIIDKKEIKVVFKRNKTPSMYRIYARIYNSDFYIGYFDRQAPKLNIKLSKNILTMNSINKFKYKFIKDAVRKIKRIRVKKKKKTNPALEQTTSNTYGEDLMYTRQNPFGEGILDTKEQSGKGIV